MATDIFRLAAELHDLYRPRAKPAPVRGAHSAVLSVKGVPVDITYNIHGRFIPATEYEPAEYPEYELVTAEVGGVSVLSWVDWLDMDTVLQDAAQDGDL